ncbi:MAG: hypothetical protein ABJD66_09730, partial [Cellulophaga sp.]|uniref:hypothetical protein n=1 Tax=Cellulophaga sp. TaxID=1972202 RepID=UPI003263D298
YSTIWLPKYYCQHVTNWLQQNFSNINFYSINAFCKTEEQLRILDFATENDIVILNNFWGVFEYQLPTTKKKPVIIEDHSHGWLSTGCLQSKADYCFASLRKTLPIPLGGILWKPNGQKININGLLLKQDQNFYENWNTIEKAMLLKADYLKNNITNNKDVYLNLIAKSENYLHKQYDVIQLKEEHKQYIKTFLNKNYTKTKTLNLETIYTAIKPSDNFKVLRYNNLVTFGLQLAFKERTLFNSLKLYLISNNIYPSELWPGNETNIVNYNFMLNIHIDFRYTKNEAEYIVETLNKWTKTNN